MQKIWVIIKREYLIRVRTKAFIISTLVSPVLMLALVILPGLLAARGGGERNVIVLDQTADSSLFDAVRKNMGQRSERRSGEGNNDFNTTSFSLTRQTVAPDRPIDEDFIKDQYQHEEKGRNNAYVVFSPAILESGEVQYFAQSTTDFSLRILENAISGAVVDARITKAGLDAGRIKELRRDIELKTRKIGPGGQITESGGAEFLVAFVMLFFIYMSVLFYGMFVMRGVIEEKQTRIVEVVISSVKPTQMMLGKVIGIGMVGLTQIGVWALSAFVLTRAGMSMFGAGAGSGLRIPSSLLVYFVMYFVLGYLLFATLYALVGATVSGEDEAQQAQFPVTMLAVIPMMVFMTVMTNPNSTSSVALSLVPFFTPTLMMMRLAVSNPPFWQVLLSIGIMIVSILGCSWLAAKIYRVGILMYGKRPNIAELGRWLRYN